MTPAPDRPWWHLPVLIGAAVAVPFLFYSPPVMPPDQVLADAFADMTGREPPLMDETGTQIAAVAVSHAATLCRVSKTGRGKVFRGNRPTGFVCLAKANAAEGPVYLLYMLNRLIFPPPQPEEWRSEPVRPERWSTTMADYDLRPADLLQP